MSSSKSNFQLSLHPTGGAVWNGNSFLTLNNVLIGFAAPGYFKNKIMRNQLTNSTAKVYYIDKVTIDGDSLVVDYTLNDEWLEITLSYTELKQFALNRSLNDYCFDYIHGEHVQDAGTLDINTFLAENLNAIIKAYLEAYPLESAIVRLNALAKDVLMYSPIERGA